MMAGDICLILEIAGASPSSSSTAATAAAL